MLERYDTVLIEDDVYGDLAGAPMPGGVLSVAVQLGDNVKEGDALCVLEAMKLETTLRAPKSGAQSNKSSTNASSDDRTI